MAQDSFPFRPESHSLTPEDSQAYIRGMTQAQLHSAILAEFEKSGMSQAELSRRTGISPDRVSRLLAQPGNWTFNTLADLLFALTGAVISGALEYPLDRKLRTQAKPAWLEANRRIDDDPNKAGTSSSSKFVLAN